MANLFHIVYIVHSVRKTREKGLSEFFFIFSIGRLRIIVPKFADFSYLVSMRHVGLNRRIKTSKKKNFNCLLSSEYLRPVAYAVDLSLFPSFTTKGIICFTIAPTPIVFK